MSCALESIDETTLLRGLRARDEAAFQELVRAYKGRLLAVARQLLRNEEDAHDAVQNTFLAVFRSALTTQPRCSYRVCSRARSWMHSLPAEYRLTLLLVALKDMTYEGIGDASAALLLSVISDVQGLESEAMLVSYVGIALPRSLSPSALSAFLGEPGDARYIGSVSLLKNQKARYQRFTLTSCMH